MHVWNGIEVDIFPRRFKSIIEASRGRFFVDCSVEPVGDYRAFAVKLRGLQRFVELSARVHPPNPLFGRLWKPLRDYIAGRNAAELNIRESDDGGAGLNTQLPTLVESILENPDFEPSQTPALTDAAILMSADGYGAGKVVGVQGDTQVVIRTSDTQKSFLYSKTPEPAELAAAAEVQFSAVSSERDLRHR